MTINDLFHWATRQLRGVHVGNAEQEARWIAESAIADFAKRLVMTPETPVDPGALRVVEDAVRQRAAGEPLQYTLGAEQFYGLEVKTPPGVLIPRPETERLVDTVLGADLPDGPVLDLCCGSGAIALALAANLPPKRFVVATDISPFAVRVAADNAARLGLFVDVRLGDLFEPVERESFAVIVANPPYVSDREYAGLPAAVRDYEPAQALRGGPRGLDLLARIAANAKVHLVPGGSVVCEIGADQGREAAALFARNGFETVAVQPDYARRDRVLAASTPPLKATKEAPG